MAQTTRNRNVATPRRGLSNRGENPGLVGDNVGSSHDNLDPRPSKGAKSSKHWLIQMDVALTNKLAVCASKDSSYGHLRPVMQLLEYSCHGIPVLTITILGILISHQISMHQRLMNLFLGLLLDLLVSFILKLAVRRQRPSHNKDDMFGTVSVDRYSFPSGHATRAGMMACLLTKHFTLGSAGEVMCVVWLMTVAASRVVLGRHHVSDVVCGVLIGFAQYFALVNWMWLSEETCEAIILPIQEDLHL